jgi:hypothetical protein
MEFARFRKSKSKRLFEQFYVVGVSSDDLELITEFDGGKARASKIFQYPQVSEVKQVQQRSKVIHDFAFPNGVRYKQLSSLKEGERDELLENMLFEIPKRRKDSFIFTLDANVDDS